MKTRQLSVLNTLRVSACCAILISACSSGAELVSDESVGLNGGFEVAERGLPVNWPMYTPRTVRGADFRIVLDTLVLKEGRQSLKFEVDRIGSRGWPGFTNEFSPIGRFRGPAQYLVSFWVRNDGSEFSVDGGPVSLKGGDMRVLVRDDAQLDEWTPFEFVIGVPQDQWLRLQLRVLRSGSFWIDDLRIQASEQ